MFPMEKRLCQSMIYFNSSLGWKGELCAVSFIPCHAGHGVVEGSNVHRLPLRTVQKLHCQQGLVVRSIDQTLGVRLFIHVGKPANKEAKA